jgi:hypothetical protein
MIPYCGLSKYRYKNRLRFEVKTFLLEADELCFYPVLRGDLSAIYGPK